MIEFRSALRKRINDLVVPVVGVGSDPTEFVRTFDKRLKDVDVAALPFLVINVRMMEKLLPGEIGNPFQKYTWTVHIYYLDMETNADHYDIADERRDHIIAKVEKALEEARLLQIGGDILQSVDTDGHREVVYDSSIQTIIFDESGDDSHQSFTCELHFEVYTDRS